MIYSGRYITGIVVFCFFLSVYFQLYVSIQLVEIFI